MINHGEIDISYNDVNHKPAGTLTKPKPLHYHSNRHMIKL